MESFARRALEYTSEVGLHVMFHLLRLIKITGKGEAVQLRIEL
jgi:hypothetical protein